MAPWPSGLCFDWRLEAGAIENSTQISSTLLFQIARVFNMNGMNLWPGLDTYLTA